ncbi:MAG: hypothetical protein KBG09_08420 [Syntrophobacterales bacterium]|nr:hypothetical protein [Syntrophobacterales bacterium]
MVTIFACAGMTGADTTIYDKNYNVLGHKKESGGTTTVYDKNWNRTGYEKGVKIYDKNRKVKGCNKGYGCGEQSKDG